MRGVAGLSAAMSGGAFEYEAWLGGEWKDGDVAVLLSEKLKVLLRAGHGIDKAWTVLDVPGSCLEDVQLKRVRDKWKAILADCVTITKGTQMISDQVRLDDWVRAQYCRTATKDVISTEFAADLAAQGMADADDMYGFELSLLLGRAVAYSECEGGAYGSPATGMQGAIKAKKSATNPSAYNIDQVVAKALETGEATMLEQWLQNLAHRLSVSSLMPYHVPGANRVLTMYQKAKTNMATPMAFICYISEVRIKYAGRGLPMTGLFDAELAIKAANTAARILDDRRNIASAFKFTSGPPSVTDSWDSGSALSSMPSSVGQSASSAGSQGSAVMEKLEALSTAMLTLASRVEDISDRVGAVEDDDDGPPNRPCWVCGSSDHKKADCPQKKSNKKK